MAKFKSWEEAEEVFYKNNDCMSDDWDKEQARIESWVEGCGHEIEEETYTEWEWKELKRKAAIMLGSLKSEKKAKTSRENGKKGGRPKKVKLVYNSKDINK